MLMLMLDLRPQAKTPGVTHFGAYHRPPDGHFSIISDKYSSLKVLINWYVFCKFIRMVKC